MKSYTIKSEYDNIDETYKISSQLQRSYRCDIVRGWKISFNYKFY
jgi:hypothetical protein